MHVSYRNIQKVEFFHLGLTGKEWLKYREMEGYGTGNRELLIEFLTNDWMEMEQPVRMVVKIGDNVIADIAFDA